MSMSSTELQELARKCRVEIVKMVHRAQAGHPGGSLSEIDLIAALYANYLRVKPVHQIGKIETALFFQKAMLHQECTLY